MIRALSAAAAAISGTPADEDDFKTAEIDKMPTTRDETNAASEKLVAGAMQCGFSFGWQSRVTVENTSACHNLPIGTDQIGHAGLGTRFAFSNDADKARLRLRSRRRRPRRWALRWPP